MTFAPLLPSPPSSRRSPVVRLIAALLLLVVVVMIPAAPAAAAARVDWAEVPQTDPAAFAQAFEPRQWRFPEDFGPHLDYQTEWWYYTGNLETSEGRPFGFQFTVFRQALAPESTGGARSARETSAWRTPQVYSAHFTVSDIEAGRFHHSERFARGSLGLAGATAAPYRVWLHDWQTAALDPEAKRVRLQAATEAMAIDLELGTLRSPVLQGEGGLSRKGPEPGNASHYYSLIQQPTQGSVRVGERTYRVSGVSWKDHEIFTNSLSPGTVGWDWFSAQFEDGSALMLYGLRHEGGGREPESAGSWIPAGDDSPMALTADDLELTVTSRWRSPHSRAIYPAGWSVRIPRLDLELTVEPELADQELTTSSATYWEGAVRYRGQRAGTGLRGRGYAELTGYADRIDERLGARPTPSDRGE